MVPRPFIHPIVPAGSLPRKLSPFQFIEGLIGLGANPPPQLGQTFPRTCSTQATQNVHSYQQIRASIESGGSALLQCSHVGLSSSMVPSYDATHNVGSIVPETFFFA